MTTEEMPQKYEASTIEEKWARLWEEWGIYRFDSEDRKKPTYAIDTPPPYPTGDFHAGNAFNWFYIDFVARYKRARGYNVLFPQGWDCHGLPVEVRTEKEYKIRKRDIPPDKFRELCIEYLTQMINSMKTSMKRLGYSIDWSREYRSMDPSYWRLSQLSFIQLYKAGYLHRDEHPVNWCPRDETAIAEAEVEYFERQTELNYIQFSVDGKPVTIATTRPELLPACVALGVNPEDEKSKHLINKKAKVPLFNYDVPILGEREVDPAFGSGIVMICTYGDKVDVRWQKRHNLPVRKANDEQGRMTELAGEYAGLKADEARSKILERLKDINLLEKQEKMRQEVGACWRCQTPVEIINTLQWFMKTREMTSQVIEWANKLQWHPEYARQRLIDWTQSLDWDWVLSRQRVFATPIPVWYCKKCEEKIVAEEDWLPVDPRIEPPRLTACPKCGSKEFRGETDVLDTWFDSSLSAAYQAGWPKDMELFERLFPADLQPNSFDIIRTWDYYLMVKGLAMFGKAPYKTFLINGLVRGKDGRMMSKSYGNYIVADEITQKNAADAFRQWAAAGGGIGSEVLFRWEEVDYAWRFLVKLWNASRFASLHLKEYDGKTLPTTMNPLDQWLLSKIQHLTERVTANMEQFEFNKALEDIRMITWHTVCDNYLEAVKHRLYGEASKDEKLSAQFTLYHTFLRILQLLSIFSPYMTEEIYQHLFKEHEGWKSLHQASWPTPKTKLIHDELESKGDLAVNLIQTARQEKSRRRLPLNAPIKMLTLSKEKESELTPFLNDIKGALKAEEIQFSEDVGKQFITLESHPEIKLVLKT